VIGIGRPAGGGKVLDFDIENRPITYYGQWPTADITSIASVWTDDPGSVEVLLLGEVTSEEMLARFMERFNQADVVTGHYIRKHDLPIINGHLIEFNMPTMSSKMVSDTKVDMIKRKDVPATQEFLLEITGSPIEKEHVTQGQWRKANRLTPEGLEITRKRVASDILGHMYMRAEMIRRGLISGPRIWDPGDWKK
jgi:hypothetical protein